MLTLDDARTTDFQDVIEHSEAVLAEYDLNKAETHTEKLKRISRTLEEMPAIFRWFCQLQSWCDHWAQNYDQSFGRKDQRYQSMRQRRDYFERMASAAKMTYEAASRRITVETSFDPTGMPRGR